MIGSIMAEKKFTLFFNNIFLYILIGFGLFDCVRIYTPLPSWFGYIKDIVIIFTSVFNSHKIRIFKYDITLFLWFLVVLFVTPVGFFHCETNQYRIVYSCIQYIEVFLLYFIFNNSERIFDKTIMEIIDIYVKGTIILCIINIFGTSIENPIINNKYAYFNEFDTMYVGRLTVGQPAVAILPILFSIIFFMCFQKVPKNNFLLVVYIVALVLSTANTAIVAIVVVFILYAIYGLKNREKSIFIKLVLLAIGIVGILLYLNLNSNSEMVEKIYNMYTNKIGAYFHGKSDISINMRLEKAITVFNSMTILDFIIGLGAYGFVNKNALLEMTTMECTYITNIVQYGIIGVTAFTAYFFSKITYLLNHFFKNRYYLFVSLEFISLLIVMVTLDLYNIFMFSFMTSIIFTLSSKKSFATSSEYLLENSSKRKM